MEKKVKDPTLYNNLYDFRADWLWTEYDHEEGEKYPNIISYFCKTSGHEPRIDGTVQKVFDESFDKVYDTQTIVRKVTDTIYTKKLTKLKNGKKKRLTMCKKFLDMYSYETYSWISLLEELRFCILNDIETITLSNKELSLIE